MSKDKINLIFTDAVPENLSDYFSVLTLWFTDVRHKKPPSSSPYLLLVVYDPLKAPLSHEMCPRSSTSTVERAYENRKRIRPK